MPIAQSPTSDRYHALGVLSDVLGDMSDCCSTSLEYWRERTRLPGSRFARAAGDLVESRAVTIHVGQYGTYLVRIGHAA